MKLLHFPIYSLDALPALDWRTLPKAKASHTWSGNLRTPELSFFLGFNQSRFLFSAEVNIAPLAPAEHSPGMFVEKLWEADVIEVFLCADQGTSYQEFNFSPAGAWWTCVFSEYRKPGKQSFTRNPSVKVISDKKTFWRIHAEVPRSVLGIPIRNYPRAANICGIFGSEPRQYLSFASLSAEQPDFHCLKELCPTKVLNITQ